MQTKRLFFGYFERCSPRSLGFRGNMHSMRLTEYQQLIVDEFGDLKGKWISHSHVLTELGGTPDDLIARGVDPRRVWQGLCDDFDVPEERRLGVDYPGK